MLHRQVAILAFLALLLGSGLRAGLPLTLCIAPDGNVYIALSAAGCCGTCEVEPPDAPPLARAQGAPDISAQQCLDCSTGALPMAGKQGSWSLNPAIRPEALAMWQSPASWFAPARAAPAPFAATAQSPLAGIILRC